MSSRMVERELNDLLQKASERHRGIAPQLGRWGAGRQAEIGIPNANHLPVLVAPGGSDPQGPVAQPGANSRGLANAALQSSDGSFFFLEGYSAPVGSSRARADATGRSGDTDLQLLTLGQGTTFTLAILYATVPITASGLAVSAGSGTLSLIIDIAAASVGASMGMATEGAAVERLSSAVGIARGRGALTALIGLSSAANAASAGAGTLYVGNALAGAGNGIAYRGTATLAGLVGAASAAQAASVGSGNLIGMGIIPIAGAAIGVARGAGNTNDGMPIILPGGSS